MRTSKSKLFGLVVILSISLVAISVINWFFLYQELGQFIYLYESRECVNIKSSNWQDSYEKCGIYGHAVGTHMLFPKDLYKGLNYVVNTVPEREETKEATNSLKSRLKYFPHDPDQWACASGGFIIDDNQKEKIWPGSLYKCWPK